MFPFRPRSPAGTSTACAAAWGLMEMPVELMLIEG
jgi:hypothetical protein